MHLSETKSFVAVVPAHNASSTIGQCIDALLTDGFEPSNIVVVDDASTDETREIADSLGVCVLRNNQTQGPATARNAGVAATSSELILFVDADVAIAPGTRETLLDAFATRPTTSAIFGSYDADPAAKRLVSQYRNLLHHHTHQSAKGNASTFWTGLGAIRRDTFNRLGGFDPGLRYLEDVELGLRIVSTGGQIELLPDLQGKHLKEWTIGSMFMTDWKGRAVPWAHLLAKRQIALGTLNTSLQHRLSAVLVPCTVLSLFVSLFQPWAFIAFVALVFALVVLNFGLFRLLYQKGGLPLIAASVVFHALHYTAAIFGVAEVALRRLRHAEINEPASGHSR